MNDPYTSVGHCHFNWMKFVISFLPNVDFEKVLIKHDKSKTGNYSQQIILNLGEEILCILMWS